MIHNLAHRVYARNELSARHCRQGTASIVDADEDEEEEAEEEGDDVVRRCRLPVSTLRLVSNSTCAATTIINTHFEP